MIVKLLTEHHFEFLSLKGGCRGLSESSLVRMSNCWKSHAAAQIYLMIIKSGHTKGVLNWMSEGSRETAGRHSLTRELVSRAHEA